MSVSLSKAWENWAATINGKMAFVAWERRWENGLWVRGKGRFTYDWSLKNVDEYDRERAKAIFEQLRYGRQDDARAVCECIMALGALGWTFTWGGEYDCEA